MPDSPANTSARKRRYAISGLGVLCGFGVFLLMAREGQLSHATAYGSILLVGFVFGLFSMLNLLEPPNGAVLLRDTVFAPLPGEPFWASPMRTGPLALIALCSIVLVLGGHSLPIGICLALAILFVSAIRRPGLMVFVVASALYLPILGRFGLWDPWETHYGEVSREILSRDDWISLWWAQDRWFWSKPILIFWVEALIWSASGLNFRPDTNPLHTEWVLRLPIYLMSITALLAVYAVVGRIWNKRAGLLGALALATMPYYAFLTHQAITDLPFVANMTTAMMLLVLGMTEDPERQAKSVKIGPFALSAQHAVIAFMVLVTMPQLLYLASRNVTLVSSGFAWHRDIFSFGSAGNPDVPGNFGLHDEAPRFNGYFVQPLAQGLYWALGLAAIVWMLRKERRVQQLYMFAFYGFCALAFMAKGIPGFALPGFVAMVFLLASGKFSLLFEGKLRVAAGMLIVTVLGMPWFVAMYVRHGSGFTDRLLVHDHLNRLTSGVHGDNGSIQYFIWQLGYGLFPWVGMLPLALGSWLVTPAGFASRLADPLERTRRDLMYTMGLWLAVSFTLFSAMTTKFHHYIFPAVPPIAVLIGLLLDRFLPRTQGLTTPRQLLPTAAALLAPVPLVVGAAGLRGDVRGILPADLSGAAREAWVFQHAWPTAGCLALIAAGVALFAYGVRAVFENETEPVVPVEPLPPLAATVEEPVGEPSLAKPEAVATVEEPGLQPELAKHEAVATLEAPALKVGTLSQIGALQGGAITVGAIAGALLLAFVARDLSWHVGQPPGSERLIHLFVYNYTRPWPENLDYRPILFGFGLIGSLFTLLIGARKLRAAATISLIGTCLAFTFFILDVYMIDLTPHWSQRDLVRTYYADRKGPEEPLLAYQMNWKGENYYTGNRVYVFVDLDNKKLLEWVDKNKGKTVYVVLEHSRLDRLKRILPGRDVKSLSDIRDNNKFVLVKTTL